MSPRTPTLANLLRMVRDRAAAELHVCLPGRVERYDAAAGVVDVKPLLKEDATAEDGSRIVESLPVVPNVPIVFPGAGGFCVTFPVNVGDFVLLVFADRSLDKWIGSGSEVDPVDPRRHALSDAFAIPGARPTAWKNAAAATNHATIGVDGGLRVHLKASTVELGETPADAAALASNTESRLAALEAAVVGHVHTSAASGSPTTPPTPSVGGMPAGAFPHPAVASATLKIPS